MEKLKRLYPLHVKLSTRQQMNKRLERFIQLISQTSIKTSKELKTTTL